MKILKIVLLIILLVAGYFSYTLGIFVKPTPKNLGVTYSENDFKSSVTKAKITYTNSPVTSNPESAIAYSGSHKVSDSFTSSELTSVANYRSWQYLPFENIQIKLNEGGVEISGNLDTSKVIGYLQAVGGLKKEEAEKIKNYIPISGKPSFYVNAKGSVKDNDLKLDLQSVSIGSVSIPKTIISENMSRIESFLEQRAREWQGFSVKSLEIKDGKLSFDGTLPDTESLSK